MDSLFESLIEIIRRTSAEIPDDVQRAILAALENEKQDTIAKSAMEIIERNIALAKEKSQPLCQDTGSVLFYVDCPVGYDQMEFADAARGAVTEATKRGFLRQNSVDSLTGKNDGTNIGPGAPTFHFHQTRETNVTVRWCSRVAAAKMSARNIHYRTRSSTPIAISMAAARSSSMPCNKLKAKAVGRASSACASAVIEPRAMSFRKHSSCAISMMKTITPNWPSWKTTFTQLQINSALARWGLAATQPCLA